MMKFFSKVLSFRQRKKRLTYIRDLSQSKVTVCKPQSKRISNPYKSIALKSNSLSVYFNNVKGLNSLERTFFNF